jgi:hypothetical protein
MMNRPIETQQIFNDKGQKIGLRYRYADGSIREIIERPIKNATKKKKR